MLKKCSNDWEYIFILDNIRDEDKNELYALYGNNWYIETKKMLANKDFLIMYGKDISGNIVPIALGGFYELYENDTSIAAVWLLSSIYVLNNKTLFFKDIVPLIKSKEKKYKIMYNYIYNSNHRAKGWLKKLGFKFDNPKPKNMEIREGFEFFYKINEREINV